MHSQLLDRRVGLAHHLAPPSAQNGPRVWPLYHMTLLSLSSVMLSLLIPTIAQATHPIAPVSDSTTPAHLRLDNRCPQDLQPLVSILLRDLPSYANRVASRNLDLTADRPSSLATVLIASQPDFEPIDLAEPAFGSGLDDPSEIRQVFFTTLERQYINDQAVSLQNHHWLFLVWGEDGWRPMRLYSSLGSYPAGVRPPTPPQESSDGIVGQAVRLWLRDCRAGTVFPLGDGTGE